MKAFHKLAKIALILVYLVIIAGAVVRMTGSGMGCPDWPKCFGYLIPPSEESEIVFKPNTAYEKGIIIIQNDSLWKANKEFKSSYAFSEADWTHYNKHSYAKYNPTHTWIEYINRLIGALSGIPILLFTILSFWLWRKNKWLTIISVVTLLGMGFQAWLGKTVVDSNLAPYKITIHMVMALVIVAFLLYLIYASKSKHQLVKYDALFRNVLLVTIVLTLIQVALGTQIRQFVDEIVKGYGGWPSWQVISSIPLFFYVHRSFSILVLILNVFLFLRNRSLNLGYSKINWVLGCIGLEILTGIAMYYFDFPFLSQPLHLVIASLLFGIQFYLYLQSRKANTLTTKGLIS